MATKGFPGVFPAGLSTGHLSIGAVQKNKGGTARGFPGVFPASLTTGYLNIGAVQKVVAVSGSLIKTFDDLANASVSSVMGLANASTKTWAGLTNV